MIDRIDGQLVGRDIGFFLSGQQRALQQQSLLQYRRQRYLGRQAVGEDILVGLVTQGFDNAAGNRQGCTAGCTQVLSGGMAGAADQFLQRFQLGLVLFLNQRRQPDAWHGLGLGAGLAGALLLFAEHACGPVGGRLRRRPGLAGQAIAARRVDGCWVGCTAAIDQVVAGTRYVADHFDRRLAGTASIAAAHPRHAILAPAGFSLFDGRHRVSARHRLAQRHALGELAPAHLAACRVGHLLGHRAAGQFGTIKIEPGLKNTVGQQVVEAGVCPLNDQRRQRCDRARRVLDHAAHDVLKTIGEAVELILDCGADVHVTAHQVAVPARAHTERVHAGRAAHGHRAAATNRIHEVVANHAAAVLETVGLGRYQVADQHQRAGQQGHLPPQRQLVEEGDRTLHCFPLS